MHRMGSFWPAAGEKILGFYASKGLIPYPPGGGWVPGLSAIRLYSQKLYAISPMVEYGSSAIQLKNPRVFLKNIAFEQLSEQIELAEKATLND